MSVLSKIPDYLYLPKNNDELKQAQRLFHGRGHAYKNLEHVTIDNLFPVILITLFKPELAEDVKILSNYLLTVLSGIKSIQVQYRYEKSGPIDVVWGEDIKSLSILEHNHRFKISLGKSRNTGLFLDMRNGRQWVEQHSQNKRVLNLFSYTCGFSVAAIAGGAKSVVNVDMSGAALSVGRENHRLNQHDLKKIRYEKINIFRSFGRLKKRGLFDLLICDPPTFQKGSVQIDKDYPKIMRRLDEFMAYKSKLLLCLNSPDLSMAFILDNMRKYAPSYVFEKYINPPRVYMDIQKKGLKTLVFTRG